MKYVFITSLYKPYVRGGAEVIVETIVDELKKNHEVYVITTSPWKGWKSLFPQKSIEDGVHVVRFYSLNIFSFITINSKSVFARVIWHLIDVFNIHSYWVIRSFLSSERPACVYTHNIKGLGYTIPLAIKHARLPHIHTLHDIQLVVPSGLLYWGEEKMEKGMQNRFHAWCSKKLFGSPNVVISPSLFLKDFYESRGFFPSSDRVLLRNPISSIDASNNLERSIHADGTIHFFAAGALNKAKGILFLCSVFHELKDNNIHLWIAGSGPDEKEIRGLCSNDPRITLLGRLTHDELLKELAHMHYSVIPSLCYENAPTILIESFSVGVPVLASDCGGTREGIEDGMNGFVFLPGDSQSLARSIKRAVGYDNYSLLSQRARQTLHGRSSMEYVRRLTQIQIP